MRQRCYLIFWVIAFFLLQSPANGMQNNSGKCFACSQPIASNSINPCEHFFHRYCVQNAIAIQKQQKKAEFTCRLIEPNCILSRKILESLERKIARTLSPESLEKCSICLSALYGNESDYSKQAVRLCSTEFNQTNIDPTLRISGHRAHRSCAISWALKNDTCSECRTHIIFTNLIPALTEQQYKQFFRAEFWIASHLSVYLALIASLGESIFNFPQNFNKAYLIFSMALLAGKPLYQALYANCAQDFDYRVVRKFPHLFWKIWAVRFMGCSLGYGSYVVLNKM